MRIEDAPSDHTQSEIIADTWFLSSISPPSLLVEILNVTIKAQEKDFHCIIHVQVGRKWIVQTRRLHDPVCETRARECTDDWSGFVAEIIVSFGSEGRSIPRSTHFCVNEQR